DPRSRAAVLAAVVEDRSGGGGGPRLEVRVGEDDVRALAAELAPDLLHVRRGQPLDLLAGGRLAREGDLADAWVGRDARAGRSARARNDVEDAVGHARLDSQLAEPQRGQRGVARGLEDRGIAGREGRGDLPARHEDREVPGDDEPDDADRLAQGEVEAGLADRDRLAEELVRGTGVVIEDEARADDLTA